MRRCTDGRRGSVLMEFLLVIPIYLLLLGMAFSLGEMGLKAIGLAHGDRLLSHAVDGQAAGVLQNLYRTRLFPSDTISWGDDIGVSGKQDSLRDAKGTYRADEGFKGAWVWQTAGRAGDDYALPPWTRGWLQYPHAHYSATTGDFSGADDGAYGDLLAVGSLGRTLIESKDTSSKVRVYNYYTLKRTALARGRNAYRNWKEPSLLRTTGYAGSPNWHGNVYKEPGIDPDGGVDVADPEKLDAAEQGGDELPSPPGGSDYDRCTQLMIWSQ